MNKLIIFSGPSGSGKTTIVKELLKTFNNIEFSVSACSRAKRDNEIDGKDYYFLSVKDFRERISKGDFVEWEEVYQGNFYGTLKSEVERIWAKGNHVVFDIDVIGGMNIKKMYAEKAISIMVKPPSLKSLEERLHSRSTESSENLKTRIAKAEEELSYESEFDKVIINSDLEIAIKEADRILSSFINH